MPAHPVTVDVIVPIYGGWAYVEQCLRALTEQTYPLHLVVIDDCGPDDTADRVAAAFPDIEFLRNESNRGFAATCNRGIRHGTGDIVILVNSDVIAEPTMVSDIVGAFEQSPDRTGSACTLLMQPDGKVDSQGITADPSMAGFVRWHGASLSMVDSAAPPVLGPYGAVAAYLRAALDEVGLLDEGIFMYGEELDLALRLRANGWGTVVLSTPSGTHLGGATAGDGSARQLYLAGFGRGYLLRAWRVLWSRHALSALIIETLVVLRRLILRRDASALRGRIAGWRAARGVQRPPRPHHGIDTSIGLIKGLRMRSARYWE